MRLLNTKTLINIILKIICVQFQAPYTSYHHSVRTHLMHTNCTMHTVHVYTYERAVQWTVISLLSPQGSDWQAAIEAICATRRGICVYKKERTEGGSGLSSISVWPVPLRWMKTRGSGHHLIKMLAAHLCHMDYSLRPCLRLRRRSGWIWAWMEVCGWCLCKNLYSSTDGLSACVWVSVCVGTVQLFLNEPHRCHKTSNAASCITRNVRSRCKSKQFCYCGSQSDTVQDQ